MSGHKYTPEEEESICREYKLCKNMYAVSRKTGFPPTSVLRILHRNNVPVQNYEEAARKYNLDQSVFENVQTEEQFYWIGYLMADGSISSTSNSISLSSADLEHLKKFAAFLKTDSPIRMRENPIGRWWEISVNSSRICKDIAHFGLVPNKETRATPHHSLLNNKYFWRGVVDGDGSCLFSKEGYFFIKICGSYDICNAFNEYVFSILGKRYSIIKANNIYAFGVCGNKAFKIASILYKNSRIFLDRKYNNYLIAQRNVAKSPKGSSRIINGI